MKIRYLLVLPAVFCLASTAWAASGVTRTLSASPAIPADGSVQVENLAGHMSVSQGAAFEVTATVMAGGAQAQALAQTIRLDVTTSGKQVTVHVHYPVNRHDRYRFHADYINDQVCMLGIICFHGNSYSDMDYQGKRVRVYQNGDEGVPLYVNVTVELPSGIHASFLNGAGLLQATKLANSLSLQTRGGNISAQQIHGDLTTKSDGGDTSLGHVTSQNLVVNTDGGDLNATQLEGVAQLKTSGGDLTLNDAGGTLQAASGGGDMHLSGNLSVLGKLDARTGGGDLRLIGDLVGLRDLSVSTGGGDAVLRVTGLSMHLDARAGGGNVNVHLPDVTNMRSGDDYFSGDLGKAAGSGTIDSGGGDITVSGN